MYKKSRLYVLLLYLLFNTAAIFSGVSSLCCGYIAITNPIVAMFGGATIALSAIAYNAYQTYCENQHTKDHSYLIELSDSIVLAERSYYHERKLELENIKKELIIIKNDLMCIKGFYIGNFTYEYLSEYVPEISKNAALISVIEEKMLSDAQKNELRNVRENELTLLEEEIEELQLLLALHANQIIDNLEYATTSYKNALAEIQEMIGYWNKNWEKLTLEIAFNVYKYDLLREYLLYRLEQATDELILVSRYYSSCASQCIQLSTTIITSLNHIVPIVNENKEWILQEENLAHRNIAIVEQYFAEKNISIVAFKNAAQKEFDEQQKKRDAEVLKKIEMEQQSNVGFGGGPKKDDDKEDDEEINKKIEVSEQDKDHIFRDAEGHFTKDTPQARKIIENMVADKSNYNGSDKYGTKWYSKIILDGQQIWAGVRDSKIRYAGINKIPWPKDKVTGLLIRPT